MGETRVDLLHLLEDLRDAYPGSLEETMLTEIIANSLDSGASRILIDADPEQTTLTWWTMAPGCSAESSPATTIWRPAQNPAGKASDSPAWELSSACSSARKS